MKIFLSSNKENDFSDDLGTIVLEDKPDLKEPPLYQVILLNDDFTPMDFVIYILKKVFGYEHERSTRIMLAVHSKGKGVCGTTWEKKETLLVPNVDEFPGHIACSSDSKSEIVLPAFKENEVFLILDVDSDKVNDFDETDKEFLQQIISLIEEKI